MAAKRINIANLLARPQGLYRLNIDPPSYLPVSSFVEIPASEPADRTFVFAVDPQKVIRPVFPAWSEIRYAHTLLGSSANILGFEGLTGERLYEKVDHLRCSGMLNIIAKARRTPLSSGGTVFDYVRELRELRQDRFFVVVPQELREHVKNSIAAELFEEASDALHRPPDGFTRAGSYKTPDRYGNLQLTFFASGDNWMADIDIDDAGGLEHVFQVARNALTGRPTHPYDIQQILIRYQEIDPGYRLILREAPTEKSRPAGEGA
jgi:hypothetical protein